jgi:hypothetical protein
MTFFNDRHMSPSHVFGFTSRISHVDHGRLDAEATDFIEARLIR